MHEWDRFQRKCGWCGNHIHEDQEIFSQGITARREIDLKDREGSIMKVKLEKRSKAIPGVITITGSQAKEEGNDILFVTCSNICAKSLRNALQEELSFPKIVK